MTADRICKAKYPANDGEGARVHGGRWNHKGTPMIYCGQTASLAALEVLATSAGLPSNMVIIQAWIPDTMKIKKLQRADLPGDWNSAVPSDSTRDIGTDWAASMETAVLSVPSAVVDREKNYLINPRHRDFGLITFSAPEPFNFDPRLK
ncbi:MAG TPA: RES domain-containing protein [Bryobacteraceae bacterium]|nr:RES domain-containing protein [Bryobacteraceae bacterium]